MLRVPYGHFDTKRFSEEKATTNLQFQKEAAVDQSLSGIENRRNEYVYPEQIKIFKETLDELRKRSIAGYLKKADKSQVELVEKLSRSFIRRIINLPAYYLKQVRERDKVNELSEILNQLFSPINHKTHGNK